MTIIQMWKERLAKIEEHDCHLSDEDGCETCVEIYDLKTKLANYEKRKQNPRHAPKIHLVVEADCDGLYFNTVNL